MIHRDAWTAPLGMAALAALIWWMLSALNAVR